jgi:hypothetical protein
MPGRHPNEPDEKPKPADSSSNANQKPAEKKVEQKEPEKKVPEQKNADDPEKFWRH